MNDDDDSDESEKSEDENYVSAQCQAITKMANNGLHHKGTVQYALEREQFTRSQSTLSLLAKSSFSDKWKQGTLHLLERVTEFKVEMLSPLEREHARNHHPLRCTVCNTPEQNCHAVVHLFGNARRDAAFNSTTMLRCEPCDCYDQCCPRRFETEFEYMGVVVPGSSCLGLLVKTLTARLFIPMAVREAAKGSLLIENVQAKWDHLMSATAANSASFQGLVSSAELSNQARIQMDSFVAAATQKYADEADDNIGIFFRVLEECNSKMQYTMQTIQSWTGFVASGEGSSGAGHEQEAQETEDEEDGKEDGVEDEVEDGCSVSDHMSDFIAPDDEEEYEDGVDDREEEEEEEEEEYDEDDEDIQVIKLRPRRGGVHADAAGARWSLMMTSKNKVVRVQPRSLAGGLGGNRQPGLPPNRQPSRPRDREPVARLEFKPQVAKPRSHPRNLLVQLGRRGPKSGLERRSSPQTSRGSLNSTVPRTWATTLEFLVAPGRAKVTTH